MSSTYDYCKSCNRYGWVAHHRCPPMWRVWVDDHHDLADEEDGLEVRADDAEEAARNGVEAWDECECDVLRGEVSVFVRPDDDPAAPGEWFVVSAEAVVEYHASPCPAPARHAKERR